MSLYISMFITIINVLIIYFVIKNKYFISVNDVTDYYRKLSKEDKQKFNKEFKLTEKNIYDYDWKLTDTRYHNDAKRIQE